MASVTTLLRAALLLGVAPLAGCGAGLITGIVANEQGNPTAEPRPPELSLTEEMPLVPAANTTRSVVVTNAQIPTSARLRVTLAALGETCEQLSPVISGQGGSTTITFTLETGDIAAAAGDPTAADVPAQLAVLVDDEPIAGSVGVLLVRQPRTVLTPGTGPTLFVSPFGQEISLWVTGLRTVDEENLQVLVETRDPEQSDPQEPATLTRPCSGVRVTPGQNAGEATVAATVPGNAFPDGAEVFVRDVTSGESTRAVFYYRPEITLALPSQGVTTGGNLVTLIGTALVPHDFTQMPAPLSFDDVELTFEKGDRVTTLAREDFRQALSAGDRLVFRMPPAPDGRPGQVDIVLRVQLEATVARVVASQVFLFANPNPFFGPRGAVLDEQPVTVVPIELDEAPQSSGVPDFAVLTEQGGAGFVQLLLTQKNGMFQRFGAPRQIGAHEVPAERDPQDLCTGDFDGDDVPDLFLANAGVGTAVHHVILGQARPLPPLGAVHRVTGTAGMAHCMTAFVDGDALVDVVLVPGPQAAPTARPQVLLSRPGGVGAPGFDAPRDIDVRPFAYQAATLEDLDGDGNVDFAVVDGNQLKLDVAFGNGDGTFASAVALDFTIPQNPAYVPDPGATAIGLHGCGNGPLQSLVLVLSGDDDGIGSDPHPVVATLHQTASRTFAGPVPGDVVEPGTNPVGVSLAGNVYANGSPEFELVVAVRGDPDPGTLVSLGAFRFVGTRFTPIGPGVQIGGELPRAFRALHFGQASPPGTSVGQDKAVFALHESEVDGSRERRLSTLLIYDDGVIPPRLLPPDAGLLSADPVLGVLAGNWSPTATADPGRVLDLALAHTDTVDIRANDGFGGLPFPGVGLTVLGLLPSSLRRVADAATPVDRIAMLDATSRLTVWRPAVDPQQSPAELLHTSGELRLLAGSPSLQGALLDDASQLEVADVDGDGVEDLVALLRFQLPAPGPADALLVLCRGKAAPSASELPFHEPTVATAVSGLATEFALGDFTAVVGPPRLELALAVPDPTTVGGVDGDHVRFFRYVAGATPADDHFVASAASGGPQVLLAGSRPTRVAARDFDRDLRVDLLVATDGDDTLRLFRNVAVAAGAGGEVEVGAFVESLSSPRALAPGEPTALRLGDVNGDGQVDAITVVGTPAGASFSGTAVAFYLSEEPGVFGDARFVSPTRLGNQPGRLSIDLGDWNRDAVIDLFLGWDTFGTGEQNLRVLFGGSR